MLSQLPVFLVWEDLEERDAVLEIYFNPAIARHWMPH